MDWTLENVVKKKSISKLDKRENERKDQMIDREKT